MMSDAMKRSPLPLSVPLKFAVLFGGKFAEHDANVFGFKYLYEEYTKTCSDKDLSFTTAYYLTRDGEVLISPIDVAQAAVHYSQCEGKTTVSVTDAFKQIQAQGEFLFLLCDGPYGTSGRFHNLADMFGIQGTFGSVLSLSLSRSKYHLGQFVSGNYEGIFIPETRYLTSEGQVAQILEVFDGTRVVIKPNALGSSLFTERFWCCPENLEEMEALVRNILEYDHRVLIQEYVNGAEYTCYCLERQGEMEIVGIKQFETPDHFLTSQDKYTSNQRVQARYVSEKEGNSPAIARMRAFSRELFRDADFQNLCRMDFIITPEDRVYFLENNANPAFKGFINAFKEKWPSYSVLDMMQICIGNELRRPVKKTAIRFL